MSGHPTTPPGPGPAEASEDTTPTDPLLAAAERIGSLPLAERPAALRRLNDAVAEELAALEEV